MPARPDRRHVLRSASYPQLFTQLERWFGIPYPFDKLDHIAIPLTVGFAMENAGLITYGAPILLAKPDAATPRFRRSAANIGAHEIAHQWFGNLVTPAWWDDIWLNEAFATWIAEKIVERWRPDYDRGAARVDERARRRSTPTCSTSARRIREPVNARGDIFNAFDSITYEKGATVIGMFEAWIGEEPFRRGVQSYLEARADGSATSRGLSRRAVASEPAAGRAGVRHLPQPERRAAGRRATRVRQARRDARADAAPADDARVGTVGVAALADSRLRARRRWRRRRRVCTLMRDESEVLSARPRVSGVRVRERGRPRLLRAVLP